MSEWLPSGDMKGTAITLKFMKGEDAWEQLPPEPATWNPQPVSQEQVRSRFTYSDLLLTTLVSMQCRCVSQIVRCALTHICFYCDQVLFRYADGAFGLYPRTLTGGAPMLFLAGVLLDPSQLWLYEAKYHDDGWVDSITWQRFKMET